MSATMFGAVAIHLRLQRELREKKLQDDLHKPGVECVDCSHPENVEVQRRIFHPAGRECQQGGVATEKEVEE